MSSERAKPVAMSLRIRVAAWIAGAVLLTSIILLGMVREGVRQALLNELDASLQADADEILLEREQHLADLARVQETMKNQARSHREGLWYAQLLDAAGQEAFSTLTTPKEPPLPTGKGGDGPESVG